METVLRADPTNPNPTKETNLEFVTDLGFVPPHLENQPPQQPPQPPCSLLLGPIFIPCYRASHLPCSAPATGGLQFCNAMTFNAFLPPPAARARRNSLEQEIRDRS